MNIDILNAYCGRELVSRPRLAQGRLNKPQTKVCIGTTLDSFRLRVFKVGARLTVYASGDDSWVFATLGQSFVRPPGFPAATERSVSAVLRPRYTLTFDLRSSEITRRI